MTQFIRNTIRFFGILVLATVLCIGSVPSASACPNCKEGFSGSSKPGEPNLAKGFYYSILFMLGTPITIVTVYSVAFYRSVKKAQYQQSLDLIASQSDETVSSKAVSDKAASSDDRSAG